MTVFMHDDDDDDDDLLPDLLMPHQLMPDSPALGDDDDDDTAGLEAVSSMFNLTERLENIAEHYLHKIIIAKRKSGVVGVKLGIHIQESGWVSAFYY